MNFKNVSSVNNGQNFGDRGCTLSRGFTVFPIQLYTGQTYFKIN